MHEMTPLSEIAALLGDDGRARMLALMMDGRAHTAGELAAAADVSASTASGHLNKLLRRRLIAVTAQGRHRYYRLGSKDVARMLESIMVVTAQSPARLPDERRVPVHLREARTCYDHIAGRLGVSMADQMTDDGFQVTEAGCGLLERLDIDLLQMRRGSRRVLCRPCLDWSERRPHLAGVLGAALFERLLQRRWVARLDHGRALKVTATGRRELLQLFGYRAPIR